MGTLQADSEAKQELDDSGCVQDEAPSSKKATENGYVGQAQLLDLSDDVLLYILRHCAPRDLKALGFTCPRLGSLILDHTLWQRVDARSQPSGRARVSWLLAYALHAGTKELMLSGYAREAKGCLGHVNQTRNESMVDKERRAMLLDIHNGRGDADSVQDGDANVRVAEPPYPLFRQHARLHFSAHQLPRLTGSPSWPDYIPESGDMGSSTNEGCAGPQFTMTHCLLRQLRVQCKELTTLCLEYCNINCKTTGINQFPPTLKKLSLRGTKCYNPPLDKSILFKIHDYLPNLEYLDVSECSWLEPASLLALSKMTSLQHLLMRHCYTMSEFVAYASLATRYGFRKLKVLDLSGSPVGDSEVSALGWIPALEELYLCPAPCTRFGEETPTHCHYKGEPLSDHIDLDKWETEEPEYFKIKEDVTWPAETSPDTSGEDIEEQLVKLSNLNNICLGRPFNMGVESVEPERPSDDERARVRANTKRVQENGSDNPEANPPGLSPKRKRPANEDSHKQNGTRKSDSENSDKEKDVSIKMNVNEGASTSKMSAQNDEKCTLKDGSQNEDKDSDDKEPKSHVSFIRQTIPTEDKIDSNSDNQGKEFTESDSKNKKPKLESYVHFRRNQESNENVQNSDSDSGDEMKKSDSKNKKHKLQSYVLFRQNQEPNLNEANSSDSEDESKKSYNKNKKPKLASYVLFRQNQEPTQNYQNEASDSDSDGSKNSQKSEDIIKPIIQSYVRFTRNQPIPTEEKIDTDSVDESKNSKKSDNQNLKPKLESFLRSRPNQEPTQNEQNSDSDSDDTNKKSDNKNKKPKLQSYVLFRQNQEPTLNIQNSDSGDDSKKCDSKNESSSSYVLFRQNQEPTLNVQNSDSGDDSKKSDSKNESSSSYVLFRQNQEPTQNEQNDSDSDSDDSKNSQQSKEKPVKPYIRFVRNQMPQNEENSDSDETEEKPENQKSKIESYVHFRQNQQPVIVQRPVAMQPEPEPIEARQHILYVNVGEQLRAVYRLHTDRREHLNIYTHHTTHVGSSSLVTDSAVRRFGRADGEDVNYVHIGPNGPYPNREVGARPDRSNLRVLSITGYRYITDRSLVHLATAAPNLRLIDFSDTGVTEQGVESFRSVRPDCEVRFSSSAEKIERTSE